MDTTVTQASPEEKKPEAATPTRNRIAIWFHDTDRELLIALDPHLQLLRLRLNKQFILHYFAYPKEMPKPPASDAYPFEKEYEGKKLKEYQDTYNNAIQGLQRAALFLPCISNAFTIQFWKDTERDPRLDSLLVQPDFPILPVLMRPTATGENHQSEPLSAHEGYQREVACQQLASAIEATLRRSPHYTAQEHQPTRSSTWFLEGSIPCFNQESEAHSQRKKRWWPFH